MNDLFRESSLLLLAKISTLQLLTQMHVIIFCADSHFLPPPTLLMREVQFGFCCSEMLHSVVAAPWADNHVGLSCKRLKWYCF